MKKLFLFVLIATFFCGLSKKNHAQSQEEFLPVVAPNSIKSGQLMKVKSVDEKFILSIPSVIFESPGTNCIGIGVEPNPHYSLSVEGNSIFHKSINVENSGTFGANVFVDDRIGIGSSSPMERLHIHNNDQVSFPSAGIKMTTISSGATATDGLNVKLNGNNADIWNYEGGALKFATNNTEYMRISNVGNVGIGTTNPGAKLDVFTDYNSGIPNGDIGMVRFKNTLCDINFAYSYQSSYKPAMHIIMNGAFPSAEVGIMVDGPDGVKAFKTDGVIECGEVKGAGEDNNLVLNVDGGNVGIGISDPTQKLEVSGTVKATDFVKADGSAIGPWVYNGTKIYYNTANVGIGINNPAAKLHIKGNYSSPLFKLQGTSESNNFATFRMQSPYNYNGTTYQCYWDYVGEKENLIFKHSSTLNSTVKKVLSLSSTEMRMNGKIYAEEIEVLANVNMPDYVFEDNYNLRSLKDVENYINTNKHLPEVPSAKEFKENGINMAEMDAVLLKKIEELTLYVIDLKKENEKMKMQIEQLKK